MINLNNERKNEQYQEQAVFHRKASHAEELQGSAMEGQMKFQVEQVVVLSDGDYRQFKETGFLEDQIFLFANDDKMWFDPNQLCWHCVLVKGETSRDGILVESEGYSYARYAAYAPDCSRLRLRDVPVHYEYPAKAPVRKKIRQKDGMER